MEDELKMSREDRFEAPREAPSVEIPKPPDRVDHVDVDDESYGDFLCPICYEFYGRVNIYQCSTGHSLCHVCAYNLDPRKCPQCRENLTGRNHGLEAAVQNLLVHLVVPEPREAKQVEVYREAEAQVEQVEVVPAEPVEVAAEAEKVETVWGPLFCCFSWRRRRATQAG